jgi:hypothetical protein
MLVLRPRRKRGRVVDIPVVGVDELIIVDAVWRVALHALDSGLAGVEGDDVVNEGLSSGQQWYGLRWVGFVVAGRVCLADLKSLTGSVGRVLWEVGCVVDVAGARHLESSGAEE